MQLDRSLLRLSSRPLGLQQPLEPNALSMPKLSSKNWQIASAHLQHLVVI